MYASGSARSITRLSPPPPAPFSMVIGTKRDRPFFMRPDSMRSLPPSVGTGWGNDRMSPMQHPQCHLALSLRRSRRAYLRSRSPMSLSLTQLILNHNAIRISTKTIRRSYIQIRVITLLKLMQQHVGHISQTGIVTQVRVVIVVDEPVVMTNFSVDKRLRAYKRQCDQLMGVERVNLPAAVDPIVFPVAARLALRGDIVISFAEITVFRNLEIIKSRDKHPNQ